MDLSDTANAHSVPFFIRECRPEEAGALLTLWQDAGTSPSVTDTITDIRSVIESPASVLVAEVNRHIVGSLIADIYQSYVHTTKGVA